MIKKIVLTSMQNEKKRNQGKSGDEPALSSLDK